MELNEESELTNMLNHMCSILNIQIKKENPILILYDICASPNITDELLNMLLISGCKIICDPNKLYQCPLKLLFTNPSLSFELFVKCVDYIIKKCSYNQIITADLDPLFEQSESHSFLHLMFQNPSFNSQMLNYLYQIDPSLAIYTLDIFGRAPLYHAILLNNNDLYQIIQTIKSYPYPNSFNSDTYIKHCIIGVTEWTFPYKFLAKALDSIVKLNEKIIEDLVRLDGNIGQLINPDYLTQEICNGFYSSEYFQKEIININYIPKKFRSNLCLIKPIGTRTKQASKTIEPPE
jgi:hypothetical protein